MHHSACSVLRAALVLCCLGWHTWQAAAHLEGVAYSQSAVQRLWATADEPVLQPTGMIHQAQLAAGGARRGSEKAVASDAGSAVQQAGQAAARRLLAQQMRAAGSPQPGSALGSVAAVPLVAAVVLMVASRFSWLRRSSKRAASPRRSSGATDTGCKSDSSGPMMVDAAVSLAEGDAACKSGLSAGDLRQEAPPAGPRPLLAGHHGWEVSSSFTSPVAGHVDGRQVHFGVLIGSGGSSRVYRGTWGGSEVAVKVLQFDRRTVSDHEQQLQQLVALDHPNVVRTHCAVTFTCQGASTAAAQPQHGSVLHSTARQDVVPRAPPGAAAITTSSSGARRDQNPPPIVLSGTPPCSSGMLDASSSSPTSSMGSALSPVGPAAGRVFRASDSSTGALSPRSSLLQQQGAGGKGPGGAAAADVGDTAAETWLVQDYCNLGSLHSMSLEWQIAGEGDLQMFERLSLLADAARGLKHLHSKGMLHGDLNAQNVMVCRSGDCVVRMVGKLSDMGACAAIKQATHPGASRTIRALSHVAPEVLRHNRAGGLASDIYSFGVLMWEVFTGQQAYRKLLDAEHLYEAVVVQNLRPKIPEGMPADYQLLMERCWASDPADRPSVDKLLGCLSVMAAERHRRLNPHAHPAPPATPAAAAAIAAAAARGPAARLSSMSHTHSCDQATLQLLVQQNAAAQQQLGTPSPLWRQGSGGVAAAAAAPGSSAPRQSSLGRLAPVVPGTYSLLQHKSCPAVTFESLLRSGSLLGRSSDSNESESDQMGEADAVFAELQEEEEMLLQLRASSQTQSGPGSAPVLHSSQPHKRYTDGLGDSMGAPLAQLGDAHMWHI